MKIQDALNGVGLLGIETAPFVYFVEQHQLCQQGSSAVSESCLKSALRAFVRQLYPQAEQAILDKGHLLALLTQDKMDKYRNGAGYDAELTIEDARAARHWVLEIVGYL